MTSTELKAKKVAELREIAVQLGIKGMEAKKKQDIINTIIAGESNKPKKKTESKSPELFDTPKTEKKDQKEIHHITEYQIVFKDIYFYITRKGYNYALDNKKLFEKFIDILDIKYSQFDELITNDETGKKAISYFRKLNCTKYIIAQTTFTDAKFITSFAKTFNNDILFKGYLVKNRE